MAPDEQTAGRRRALLVATATYGDPGLAALRAPSGDVASLAAVLGDASIGGFDVRELIDRPTEELKKEIETFFDEGRPTDLLLLYVSGHGVLSQSRRFYFATASTALQWLRSTAIEDSFVNDVMQHSRARSIVLVIDCCHSGAFGKGLVPKSARSVDVEHRFEGRGRVTLTASTELEYAFEEADPATGINELDPAAPGSLFTRAVVEGLRSGDADVDEDGRVTVDDLYDYVCRRVRERSVHQTPGMAGDVRGQIVIARSAAREIAPPPEPAPPPPPEVAPPARRRPPWRIIAGAGAAAAAAIVAAVLALGGSSPPAAAQPYDFAGDARQDVVLGLADAAKKGSDVDAGVVLVARADGEIVALTGDDAGVPPPASAKDRFGTAVASGDFDADGRADLAVSATGRNAVYVLYDLDGRRQPISADDLSDRTGARLFGFALVARDFNRDGFADLAVGTPGTLDERKAGRQGEVDLLLGGRRGLGVANARRLDPGFAVGFGTRLAAGDFDRDGNVDLAVGAPDEVGAGVTGNLAYCAGTPAGPGSCRQVQGAGGTSALAIADVNGDGYGDIVQGDSGGGSTDRPGSVRLWLGGTRPLPSEPRELAPASVGFQGTGGDEFGHDVIAADLDGDHRAEVIVAARSAGDGTGAVTVIRGSRRLGTAGAYQLKRVAPEGTQFGATLSLLDTDDDQLPELFVGVKGAHSLDDALVAYPGRKGGFGDGQAVPGLARVAKAAPTSPLRLGR